MMLPRPALPLALLAAVLAGCGGGGGDSRLTASEYTQQATKICQDSDKKTNALKEPTTAAEIKGFLQKGVDVTQPALDEFKKLKPPKDLEAKHKAAADAEQGALDRLNEVAQSLKGNSSDAAAFQKVSPELDRINKDVKAKLTAAGLPKCAT
jgi:hypothetical protein